MATDKTDENNNINLAFSGWSGAGITTLALIFSLLLKRRYLHVGGIFREIGSKLGYSEEGSSRPKFDERYEQIIGTTIDRYVDYLLLNGENLLVDSDLGTLRIGRHPKVFSVFVKAAPEQRLERMLAADENERAEDVASRDKILHDKYLEIEDINIFDEELIDRKFNLVIDNTNMQVETSAGKVIAAMQEYHILDWLDWAEISEQLPAVLTELETHGKDGIRAKLKKQGMLFTARDAMEDIARTFPEDIAGFPENLQKMFLGQ